MEFLSHVNWAFYVLRLAVGIIFLVHGVQKFKMWKMKPSQQMTGGMINLMRFLSIAEPLGALGVLSGVLIQWAALGLALVMLGAIYMKSQKWGKKFTGDGGWEFDFIIIAVCVTLYLLGAGAFSLLK